MFYCANHGWSHPNWSCPECVVYETSASTDSIPTDAFIGIKKSELERLRTQLSLAVSALENTDCVATRAKVTHAKGVKCSRCDTLAKIKGDNEKDTQK